jgi:hypothetical protein
VVQAAAGAEAAGRVAVELRAETATCHERLAAAEGALAAVNRTGVATQDSAAAVIDLRSQVVSDFQSTCKNISPFISLRSWQHVSKL